MINKIVADKIGLVKSKINQIKYNTQYTDGILLLHLQNLEILHHFLSFLMTFKLLSLPYLLHHMTFSLQEILTFMLTI